MSPALSSPAGLDGDAVEAWMAAVDRRAAPPIRFARLGHGKSNLTFLAEDSEHHRWVLRRPPLGRVAMSAHDVVREQGILSRLEGTDVPVPRVVAVTEDPMISDVPLVLLEHVDGIVLNDGDDVRSVPPAVRRELGHSLARTLSRIHAVDLDGTGLTDLSSHKPYAPRQLRRWLGQWELSGTREAPLVTRLAEALREKAPREGAVSLLHGDFHLQNVILRPFAPDVQAVVDWELSTLGDPIADLGTLLAYWPQSADDPVAELMGMWLPPGFPSRGQMVDAYSTDSGRDVSAVQYWEALGYWKLAIIAEGVRRRRLDEPMNGEPIRLELIDALLERARELL